MRGIETAFEGVLGREPELRTSKTGKAFATLAIAVTTGQVEDGADLTTWVRTTCFGETAKEIAATAHKRSRVYVEGSLTLNTWETTAGEQRTGLNCAAWKVIVLGQIGQRRPKQARNPSAAEAKANGGAAYEHDFNDPLPF